MLDPGDNLETAEQVGCVNGYGFPADKGGPMAWADGEGVATILDRLRTLQSQFGEHWQPAALIERLAAAG